MCVCVSGLWLKPLCLCQVFREQAIDGETLPLLTEKHLLSTMGLKLGPALRIRSQVHTHHSPACASVCEQVCVCVRVSTKSVAEFQRVASPSRCSLSLLSPPPVQPSLSVSLTANADLSLCLL